jgi:fatty-acyl-CoA synthase
MAAVELRAGAAFDPAAFDAFLAGQPDLGPKWLPSFVRVTGELPKLASMKVDKRRLRHEAWRAEQVFWRPASGEQLQPLDDAGRARLDPLLGRGQKLR